MKNSIFFVGVEDKRIEKAQLHFSDLLKKNNKSELVYDLKTGFNYFAPGTWNSNEWGINHTFVGWVSTQEGIVLTVSLEFPYALNGKQLITAENARAFGHDMVAAMKEYMQESKTFNL